MTVSKSSEKYNLELRNLCLEMRKVAFNFLMPNYTRLGPEWGLPHVNEEVFSEVLVDSL